MRYHYHMPEHCDCGGPTPETLASVLIPCTMVLLAFYYQQHRVIQAIGAELYVWGRELRSASQLCECGPFILGIVGVPAVGPQCSVSDNIFRQHDIIYNGGKILLRGSILKRFECR